MSCNFTSPKSGVYGFLLVTLLLFPHISFANITSRFTQEDAIVNLEKGNYKLGSIFRIIEKQTGLIFNYGTDYVNIKEEVFINKYSKVKLQQVLEDLLTPRKLKWTLVGKDISLSPLNLQNAPHIPFIITDTTINISGTIKDEQGQPIVGATIRIKGSQSGKNTDQNGRFELVDVKRNSYLTISSIGFLSKDVYVGDKKSIGVINLKLYVSELDETVVIAYGTTTARTAIGNVSTITAKEIERSPVTNPLLAMQGRVPGVYITQTSGISGGPVNVTIQGQNSIAKGNDPFYVIDGVPYTSTTLPSVGLGITGTNGATTGGGNPMNYINPLDIESISVLKDADATAIYGSRAANGAILITTKRGTQGQTKININIQEGYGKVAHKLDMMNTKQYIEMRKEAYRNDGVTTIPSTAYDINGTWDTTRYTDWQKELIGRTARYSNANISISGGSADLQYSISGTYNKTTTVFPTSFNDIKGSTHFSINSSSFEKRLNMSISATYQIDNNTLPDRDLTFSAIRLSPNAPALYNEDGTINWALNQNGVSTWLTPGQPIANLLNKFKSNTKNLIANAMLSYQLFDGLELKTSLGYTDMHTNEKVTYPLTSTQPSRRPSTDRIAEYGYNEISSWIIEPQLNYKRTIGSGQLDLLIGSSFQANEVDGNRYQGLGYNSDLVLEDPLSATTITSTSSTKATYKYNALFGRIGYNWKHKYLINLTARRDGSSRFGSENRFHNFGAAGIGWVFTEEEFIRNNIPFVNFGKFRVSYGTTGNDQIGDYQYLNLYIPSNVEIAYRGGTGLKPNGIANPYLQWEETQKINFGADLNFFNNALAININYYRNRSSNQLLGYVLPIITGVPGVTLNFPATVQNSGWETSIQTNNFNTKNFKWSTNFNISLPKNKLVKYKNSEAAASSIGQPISIRRVFEMIGVDPATGLYQFADINGKPTSKPDDTKDAKLLFNPFPKYYGGLQNTITFMGFTIDFLFQFVKKDGIDYSLGSSPGIRINQPITVLDRWQKPGDVASIQMYSSDGHLTDQLGAAANSNAVYKDASFIRLKNASLSWQLPAGRVTKTKIKNARIFVQGQNLATITNYFGLDPETLSVTTLPPLRIMTAGINLTL